jgi:cytochrome c oxidase subunit 2
MRFRVFVDTQPDFDAWAANEASDGAEPMSELAMQGKEIFLQSACIGCHVVQGTQAIGIVGPNLSHVGNRTTIAAGIMENTPENLVAWISNPDREKPGVDPANDGRFMPAFENQLTREQIEAIAAYLLELK